MSISSGSTSGSASFLLIISSKTYLIKNKTTANKDEAEHRIREVFSKLSVRTERQIKTLCASVLFSGNVNSVYVMFTYSRMDGRNSFKFQ